MIIMRLPQQGQAFRSSCSRPSSAPSPSSLDGAGSLALADVLRRGFVPFRVMVTVEIGPTLAARAKERGPWHLAPKGVQQSSQLLRICVRSCRGASAQHHSHAGETGAYCSIEKHRHERYGRRHEQTPRCRRLRDDPGSHGGATPCARARRGRPNRNTVGPSDATPPKHILVLAECRACGWAEPGSPIRPNTRPVRSRGTFLISA